MAAVSHKALMAWVCPGCRRPNEAAIWDIVLVSERPDSLDNPIWLAYETCEGCGYAYPIDLPLLLIDPASVVPLILALPDRLMEDPDSPEVSALTSHVQAHGDETVTSLPGPMQVVPRGLITLIVERELESDLVDISAAVEELDRWDKHNYRTFLQGVRILERRARVGAAIDELRGCRTAQECAEVFSSRQELRSRTAVELVKEWIRRGPPAGETPGPMVAVLHLLQDLRNGRSVDDAFTQYQGTFLNLFDDVIRPRLAAADELLASSEALPYSVSAASTLREAADTCRTGGMDSDELPYRDALATVLLRDEGESKAESREEAIKGFERVIELAEFVDNPVAKASALGNLGIAYADRTTGDPLEHLLLAETAILKALETTTKASDPDVWALNQTNLALVYLNRNEGPQDAEAARGRLSAALTVRSRDRNAEDWAYSTFNLGLAFRKREHGEYVENQLSALHAYEDALEVFTAASYPDVWRQGQVNGAIVLLELGSRIRKGNRNPEDLLQPGAVSDPRAERFFGAAPAIPEQARAMGLDWSAAGLANQAVDMLLAARQSLANRDHVRQAAHINKILAQAAQEFPDLTHGLEPIPLLQEAMAGLDPHRTPQDFLDVADRLGDLYARAEKWDEAGEAFYHGAEALGNLVGSLEDGDRRLAKLAEHPRLHRWAAGCLVRANRLFEAVEVLERGRAVDLSARLARDEADLKRVRNIDSVAADRFSETRHALSVIEKSIGTQQQGALQEVRGQYIAALDDIRRLPGCADFLSAPTIEDITQAVKEGRPLAYLVSSPTGSWALLCRKEQNELIIEALGSTAHTSGDLVDPMLRALLSGPYTDTGANSGEFDEYLNAVLGDLDVAFMGKLRARLTDLRQTRIALICTGLMGLLPVHAVQGRGLGRFFLDEFSVSFLPSARSLTAARRRAVRLSGRGPETFVAIADPGGERSGLPGTVAEVKQIAESMFFEDTRIAVGPTATSSWLRTHASDATVLHLGCHGKGASLTGEGPRIYLRDGPFTVGDARSLRGFSARLVVASACQTGLYEHATVPEEYVGLPSAFLEAGAAAVIATLWNVHDRVTALLMVRLYENLFRSDSSNDLDEIANALRDAQGWIRELTPPEETKFLEDRPVLRALLTQGGQRTAAPTDTPHQPKESLYSSPRYWAPFYMVGA